LLRNIKKKKILPSRVNWGEAGWGISLLKSKFWKLVKGLPVFLHFAPEYRGEKGQMGRKGFKGYAFKRNLNGDVSLLLF